MFCVLSEPFCEFWQISSCCLHGLHKGFPPSMWLMLFLLHACSLINPRLNSLQARVVTLPIFCAIMIQWNLRSKIMVVGAQAKSNFVGVIILLLESFNTKNSKNQSHITLLQKVRATRGLVSHITTSMMVFWRTWANFFGTKGPKWNTNNIARKGLKILSIF